MFIESSPQQFRANFHYFKTSFNAALKFGLDNRKIVISDLAKVNNQDMDDYLNRKIDFVLDEKKMLALTKFLELMNTL